MDNWINYKKLIMKNKIDYDQLVDQINYPLHYLAYHSKNDLIFEIPDEILTEFSSQKNLEGNTVLHIASKLNNIALFIFMVEYNLDTIYEKNNLNYSPLYYLIDDYTFIKKFVKKYHIIDHFIGSVSTDSESSLIDYYILEPNIEMVNYIVKHVPCSNHSLFTIVDSSLNTSETKIKLLSLFIGCKLNINKLEDGTFLSPLIKAVNYNDFELTEFLLENGANTNYFGAENSDNPLFTAISNENNKIIKLLLKYNIDVDIQDKYLQTAIHYLYNEKKGISKKNKKLLLDRTKNINSVDNKMNSILSLIIQYDDWKLYTDILKKHKLKIYLKNKLGKAPIDYVKEKELFYEMVYSSYINLLDLHTEGESSEPMFNQLETTPNKQLIMNKIINEKQSYPTIKKYIPIIKIINTPKVNITHFSPTTYDYICYLYYILNKYPEIKLCIGATDQFVNKSLSDYYVELTKNFSLNNKENKQFRSLIKDCINHHPLLINHLIIWESPEKCFISPYIIQGINETLKKYPNTKIILFKLSIITEENGRHANILIYDIVNKSIERFDPYGKVPYFNGVEIDSLLKDFFSDFLPQIKYIDSAKLSKGISFQVYDDEHNIENKMENDPNGFCVAWCLWYVETRILNTNIGQQLLISKTINKINEQEEKFRDYIRNYSDFLAGERNILFEKAGINKRYWYANHFPFDIHELYLQYMRKIFNKIF